MPPELVSKLSGGMGLGIPAGYEFNQLDAISEAAYRAGTPQRAPTPPGSHSSSSGLKSTGYVGDHPVPDKPYHDPIMDAAQHYNSSTNYHDPIMDAAKKYSSSKVYHDPIMDLAKTYHPPAQPLAHPVSKPHLASYPSSNLPGVSPIVGLSNLPYSLGTPVTVPSSYAPITSAPLISPRPMPRPTGQLSEDAFGNLHYKSPTGETWDTTKLNDMFSGTANPPGTVKKAVGGGFGFVDIKTGLPHQSQQGSGNLSGGPAGSGGAGSHESAAERASERNKDHRGHPVLLDLDGNGVTINELSRSTVFKDAGCMKRRWVTDSPTAPIGRCRDKPAAISSAHLIAQGSAPPPVPISASPRRP